MVVQMHIGIPKRPQARREFAGVTQVLGHLGDREANAASLAQAKATLDAIDVIGITEHMEASLVLFSKVWKLPLAAVGRSYTSLLTTPTPHPVNQTEREVIARHPAVVVEQQLYEYALARFTRDVAAIDDLDAQIAFLKSRAVRCTIARACTGPDGADTSRPRVVR